MHITETARLRAQATFFAELSSATIVPDIETLQALQHVQAELAETAGVVPDNRFIEPEGLLRDRYEDMKPQVDARLKRRREAPEFDAAQTAQTLIEIARDLRAVETTEQVGFVANRLIYVCDSIANAQEAQAQAQREVNIRAGKLPMSEVVMLRIMDERSEHIPGWTGIEGALRRMGVEIDDPAVRARIVERGLLEA